MEFRNNFNPGQISQKNHHLSLQSKENQIHNLIFEYEVSTQNSIISEMDTTNNIVTCEIQTPNRQISFIKSQLNESRKYKQYLDTIDEKELTEKVQQNLDALDSFIHAKTPKRPTSEIEHERPCESEPIRPEKPTKRPKANQPSRKIFKIPKFNLKKHVAFSDIRHPELYRDLTAKNLQSRPDKAVLCNMSLEQLSCVEDFILENEHGKIQFLDPVNLTNLDLQRTLAISKGQIEVYPDAFYQPNWNKPARGRELNVPARLTYKNVRAPKAQSTGEFVASLESRTRAMGAIFEGYCATRRELWIWVNGF